MQLAMKLKDQANVLPNIWQISGFKADYSWLTTVHILL